MIPREPALLMLRQMRLIRRFEERCAELYGQEKIRGFLHLYIGEEAVAVGSAQALRPDDAVVATYREHGHALLRGVTPAAVMAEMFGRTTGCSRGRGGSMHLFDAEHRLYGGNAIVAGGIPLAVGLALADQMQSRPRLTACYFGDGATAEGEYHESLNLAQLWRLPVLFLCENNGYAMGTALERYKAMVDLAREAEGHGVHAERVDGMDVLAVLDATRRAVDAIRTGDGPQFLELRTYRFRAHSMYDPDRYRDKAEIARWKERDPIALFERRLAEEHLADASDFDRIEREVTEQVETAISEADAAPVEPIEHLLRDVVAVERQP